MDKENHAKPCRHIIDLDLWKAPKTVDILDLPTLTRKRRSHLPGCVQNSYLSYFWTQRTPNNTIKFFEQHGLESLGFVKGCRAIYKKLILSSILFYVFHRYIGLCCSLGHTGDKSFDIHLWYQISYHTYPAKTTDIDSAHRRNIYNSALDKFDFLYIALGTSSHQQLTYDFSFFQEFCQCSWHLQGPQTETCWDVNCWICQCCLHMISSDWWGVPIQVSLVGAQDHNAVIYCGTSKYYTEIHLLLETSPIYSYAGEAMWTI